MATVRIDSVESPALIEAVFDEIDFPQGRPRTSGVPG